MEAQPIATFASPEIAGFEEEGDRVRKLLVARAFVVSVILLVTFAVQASVPADYSGPYREVYGLISLEYALLIAQGLLLQGALERHPVQIAAAQFALDIAFLTALVALTGGTSSIFSFFYVLIVLGAALGLGRPGAYAAAGACSVAYAGLGLTEFFDLGISRYDLVPGYPPPATEMLPISASVLVAANLLVAFLASYLVDMVGQRDSAMRNSSERFRELSALHSRIVQSISSGVITVDAVGRMTSINRAAREITGFTEDDILFRPVELLSPDFYKRICSTDDDPEAQAERWETPFTRRDGETRFLGFATSRLAADGLGEEAADCGHVVIFQDLTKLKELERRSAEDARLRSIGELAAAIAHEIRNPLASMSGCVEMLGRDEVILERGGKLLKIVLRESDRLNALITDFLAYARPDRLVREPVEIGAIIDDLALLSAAADPASGVRIECAVKPGLAVMGDARRLHQLLLNLIRNAFEAVGSAGRVLVRAWRSAPGWISIAVEDDGPGVPDSERTRILEPFYTTKEGGTGLGLSVVHRIVGAHGGRLAIERSALGGACFRIDLPENPRPDLDDDAGDAARTEA